MTGPLHDRAVIITGASRRIAIGAAIARRAVTDGASVLLHSFSPHDAEQPWGADSGGPQALVKELRVAGGHVEHLAPTRRPRRPRRTSRCPRRRP